ncbi:MAG TPA: ComEC/Rec2 family competence protein, partial [Candidatus Saccharimonadales bacterium]|nr:ComEC/Rec2 family competence protein [Candidatus Saccharimonadales bacterium]
DKVIVKAKLAEGFGGFSASMFRAEVVSIKRSNDVALEVRDWFSEQVRKVIDEPAAALGLGFLTGQKQGLPPELEEAMKTAGLTHIIVASGYNLTILVRLARRTFARISKYLAALASAGLISGFMAVTGASPSMSRAGLVAGLCLVAWYYGRKFHPLVLLPCAAAITLLANPTYGWGDLGWQLSFAAFAGVMIVAPLMQAYFFGSKKPGMIRQIAGETIAAQVATLPILIGAFGQFSNVALFANLLTVPLVPLAMLLVFLTGLCAAFILPIAGIIGGGATLLLSYMIAVTNFFASQTWALTEMTLPWYGIVISYVVLIGVSGYFWWATRFNLRSANIVE